MSDQNQNAFGAFANSMASGENAQRTAEARSILLANAELNRPQVTLGGVSSPADGAAVTPAGSGDTSSAQPNMSSDPVNPNMAPYQKAFLNAISGGESAGKYNIRYDGGAGSTFSDYSHHPNILVPTADGQKSSAAGRYQFTGSTWNAMGGGDFSPANQDAKAYQLAQQRYKATTGRDLDGDLQKDGLSSNIMNALTPTWKSLAGEKGQGNAVANYNATIGRLGNSSPAASGGAGAPIDRGLDGALKQVGQDESANRDSISSYLSDGGYPMDPVKTPWCAAWTGATLNKIGIAPVPPDKGGNIATSYLNWGTPVAPGQTKKGDVIVEDHGKSAGQTGGHVSIATGNVDADGRIEVISGNHGDKVGLDWLPPGVGVARRGSATAQTQSNPSNPRSVISDTPISITPGGVLGFMQKAFPQARGLNS